MPLLGRRAAPRRPAPSGSTGRPGQRPLLATDISGLWFTVRCVLQHPRELLKRDAERLLVVSEEGSSVIVAQAIDSGQWAVMTAVPRGMCWAAVIGTAGTPPLLTQRPT